MAVASASATMKLACRSRSLRRRGGSLEPGLLDQACQRRGRVSDLEDQPAGLMTIGLVLFLDDPDPPHSPDNGLRDPRARARIPPQDDRFVQVRLAISKAEIVAVADLDLALGVDDGGSENDGTDPNPGGRL